jgi:hypothetical protein
VTLRLDAELRRQFERQARTVLDAQEEKVRAVGSRRVRRRGTVRLPYPYR